MLGSLLRRSSPNAGHNLRNSHQHQHQGQNAYDISPMLSNSTISTITAATNNTPAPSLESIHLNRPEEPCSCTDAVCSTLPMLDHVSDELKYKLFASKNMNYGTASYSTSTTCSSYAFRVLIVEEQAQMTNKNNYTVVLDYSTANESTNYGQIRPNELKEYIFGSPVRSKESLQENKFRTIPNSELVMITRIFHSPKSNNRLAVSICVPMELLSIISEAWTQVSQWLDECQGILLGILRKRSKCNCYFLPNNMKETHPKECQSVISLLQRKLIPCLKSTSQIPRLFLYPETFQSFVGTWFKDIFSWIGIKDGPRLNFLPALLAKIICDFQNPTKAQYTTRIVIMSGNMVVANKLIFILSGLLEPRYRGDVELKSEQEKISHSQESFQKPDNSKKASSFLETSNTDLTKSSSTRRPWEIPYNNSSSSVVSVSSNESLAHVIQPSSLKSSSNSLQYLSSSLSSQQGSSYGSWFKKRPNVTQLLHGSPSAKSSDQWEKNSTGSVRKNSSNSSLHQMFSKNMGYGTPQQSPSINEYDEYPWFGTPTTCKTESTAHHSTVSYNGNILGEVNIERDPQRLNQTDLLDDAFNQICRPDSKSQGSEYEIVPGDSRHAAFMQIDVDYDTVNQSIPSELLPRYTTYLTNFNRWFNLQAFPVSSESESRVISNMRKDIQTNDHNVDSNASSKTLLVSLRSREIKEITIMRNDLHSITTPSHGIVQKTKKIFNNGKCGNISTRLINCIAFVNASIKKAMDIYDDADVIQEQKDEEIHRIFISLLHYTRNNSA
ncbi:hypothetical protein HG535_0E05310 [Zygotorulaspora mrakii]|uniref:Protein LST4 n=1 Tax=Zygotorulaspora mrakii TaxID=42260 RepID=A0A7H9B4H4_ZYGMR|nr:uncharacterized protein HG535_0E05310 [Zygotorulaspora mrakii]QLG73447.1 hypothetical protein HG535_0E05310 [Zygotorulaspora mrakii]